LTRLCAKAGVNVNELLYRSPTGEQALEIADMRCVPVRWMCVVDSVAALTPSRNRRRDGDSHMGLQARLMSQALRKLTANIKRSIPGDFHQPDPHENRRMFGNPETTTGGNALKFYARAPGIRRIGSIKRGEEVVGSETRVKVSRQSRAAVQASRIRHPVREGISRQGEVIELA